MKSGIWWLVAIVIWAPAVSQARIMAVQCHRVRMDDRQAEFPTDLKIRIDTVKAIVNDIQDCGKVGYSNGNDAGINGFQPTCPLPPPPTTRSSGVPTADEIIQSLRPVPGPTPDARYHVAIDPKEVAWAVRDYMHSYSATLDLATDVLSVTDTCLRCIVIVNHEGSYHCRILSH